MAFAVEEVVGGEVVEDLGGQLAGAVGVVRVFEDFADESEAVG